MIELRQQHGAGWAPSAPTIQLVTSDGFCVDATMTDVTTDDGLQFKAKKK